MLVEERQRVLNRCNPYGRILFANEIVEKKKFQDL